MTVTLESLRAIPLTASFAAIYGGVDRIPEEIRRPSSHFQAIPRIGQYCTLVLVRSSDGATGIGECFGLPTPYPAAEIVNRVMAPALVGKPLGAPAEMTEMLRRFFVALGHTRGPSMEALSGVDIALWDMMARQAGQPLATFLGAAPCAVPTYVSPVPFLPTPEHSAKAAQQLMGDFAGVKLKIGRSAVADDLAHIAAVRDAIGAGRQLMLDANCAYDLPAAQALIDGLAGMDIAWLEEPLSPDDIDGLRQLSLETDIPLAGGENEFTPAALERLMDQTGVRILQPNVSRLGGISALIELDKMTHKRGARIAMHGVGASVVVASSLHLGAALDSVSIFEVNRLPNPLRDRLGAPVTFGANGHATPPDGPGHGVEIADADLVEFSDPASNAA